MARYAVHVYHVTVSAVATLYLLAPPRRPQASACGYRTTLPPVPCPHAARPDRHGHRHRHPPPRRCARADRPCWRAGLNSPGVVPVIVQTPTSPVACCQMRSVAPSPSTSSAATMAHWRSGIVGSQTPDRRVVPCINQTAMCPLLVCRQMRSACHLRRGRRRHEVHPKPGFRTARSPGRRGPSTHTPTIPVGVCCQSEIGVAISIQVATAAELPVRIRDLGKNCRRQVGLPACTRRRRRHWRVARAGRPCHRRSGRAGSCGPRAGAVQVRERAAGHRGGRRVRGEGLVAGPRIDPAGVRVHERKGDAGGWYCPRIVLPVPSTRMPAPTVLLT